MPTALRWGPYRFFFFSSDRSEPPHVHVERDDGIAKFWLDPVDLESSDGLSRVELARMARLVAENRSALLEAWHDFFSD
ncbi:MAG: DUF4160 domain-containing protein [Burkholderiaceae bacterium]|nr:DUF4160 domain-containing protein [Burkholderiaceae bacterium]